MADIQKTVSIIFLGEDKASSAIGGIDSKLGSLGTNAGDATGKVGQLGTELDKVGDSDASVLRAVDAMKALAAALVVKEFIDANINAEQFRKTLELSTGSAELAQKEYEYVAQVADRLGLELQSTALAYAQFTSATKGSALEGEGAKIVFEAFAGTMSAVGSSAADIEGAMVQLAQGVSKGKFELEDLKSIAERVPGFFTKFSASLGVTTDELYSMISAGQIGGPEILKFAESLNEGLSGVDFDGFINSLNRFKNAQTETFVILGDAGAFDVLTKGLEVGTAAIVGAIAAFTLLGEIAGAVDGALATGDFSGLGKAVDEAMTKAAEKTTLARDRMLNLTDETKKAGDSGVEAGTKIADGMEKGKASAADLAKASKEVDAALKALGIDPKQFKDPLAEVLNAFNALAKNPAVTGEQFLSGLLVTLDKIKATDPESIAQVVQGIAAAYQNGTINADQYTAAIEALNVKQSGLWEGMIRTAAAGDKNAEALKKQKDEAAKATEAANKYHLEMQKLASDERIAAINAKVNLDIAQAQANAQIMQSTFESINTTIGSTGELLGTLFGGLKKLSGSDYTLVRDQIELENERRQEALDLQKELTVAQIDEMRARTAAMVNGDALIKIDGAGLQPHLEAFMWEILRTIQTRVNADGMEMLLGA